MMGALLRHLLLVFLLAGLYSGNALAGNGTNSGTGPHYPLPKEAKSCIRDTGYMRRNHMKLLLHKRDRTMHEGIRTKNDSLANCIRCHASKDKAGKPIPVNAPGQFCSSCHEYAAVKLDCFECHRTTPETPDKSAGADATRAHGGLFAENSIERQRLYRYLKEAGK